MPVVQIPLDNLAWPPRCCRCGNAGYVLRNHKDQVVTRTLLSVTEYRNVTLTIPVCSSCARVQWLWFGAAIVSGAVGTALLLLMSTPDDVSPFVPPLYIAAVVLAWIGVHQRPLRVLGFNDQTRLLSVRIYDGETAAHMARVTDTLVADLKRSGNLKECPSCGNWMVSASGPAAGTFRCAPCAAKRRRRTLILILIGVIVLSIVAAAMGF